MSKKVLSLEEIESQTMVELPDRKLMCHRGRHKEWLFFFFKNPTDLQQACFQAAAAQQINNSTVNVVCYNIALVNNQVVSHTHFQQACFQAVVAQEIKNSTVNVVCYNIAIMNNQVTVLK